MKHIEQLQKLCSSSIFADSPRLKHYQRDQVDEKQYWQLPKAVLFPKNTPELVAIMCYAKEHGIPVTARGGGSGLAGGAIAVEGGVIISLEKMNTIHEVDTVNSVAIVDAGVVTGDLDRHLQNYGLFFPAYPISNSISCIGGNVACNAGGSRAIKYGVTGHHVLGAECVLADGRVLPLGGRYIKQVSGYNILSLLVGSEGTLAILSKLTLRLMPRPSDQAAGLFVFDSFETAIQAISHIRNRATPSALEYMDRLSVITTDPEYATIVPLGALLVLVEVDGHSRESVSDQWDTIVAICKEHSGKLSIQANNADEHKTLWKLRSEIPWALKRQCREFHEVEDTVVPLGALAEYTSYIYALSDQYQVPMAVFGHAGDGNVHIVPIKPPALSSDAWYTCLNTIQHALYAKVRELGGCISGEHGIGLKRRDFLREIISPTEYELFQSIKAAFDPTNILNPGKVIHPK